MADPQQPAVPPPPGASDVTPSLGPASLGSGSRLDKVRSIFNSLSGGGIPAIQERLDADFALRRQNAQNDLNRATQNSQYKAHAVNTVDNSIDPATGQPRAPFGINPLTGKPATAKDHQTWSNEIAAGTEGYKKTLPKDAKPIADKLFGIVHQMSGHKPQEGGGAAALPTAGDFGGETANPTTPGRPAAISPPPQPTATAGPAVPPPPSASQNPMEIPSYVGPSVANPAVMAGPENQRAFAENIGLAKQKAELAQQMGSSQTVFGKNGEISQQAISKTGEPLGAPIQNVMPAKMFNPAWYHPISIVGPDGVTPIPAVLNKMNNKIYNEDMEEVPNARMFTGSLVSKTTNRDVTTPGGLTTHTRSTVGPAGKAGVGGSTTKTGSGRPAAMVAPAVSAAMDQIMKEGIPNGKLDDAHALAMQQLQKQGVDPQVIATMGARGQADTAKMIQPLIARARQLIALNPQALGPLAGRWSELSQKAGNLEGAPKELAGTLTSIYSLAGKLHGWRSIRIADEFRKTYGDLSNTPASLNSGLDAMEGTTNDIIKTVYPNQKSNAAPRQWNAKSGRYE